MTMTERTQSAGDTEGGSNGFLQRILGDFTLPLYVGLESPISGRGLGLGTNAGAALATGSTDYQIAEAEWARIVGEAGLVGGGLFIALRTWIVVLLGMRGLRSVRQGNVLPLLLLGAAAPQLWNGQWGQPTSLGFAMFVGGLTWAASESKAPVMPLALRPVLLGARQLHQVRS